MDPDRLKAKERGLHSLQRHKQKKASAAADDSVDLSLSQVDFPSVVGESESPMTGAWNSTSELEDTPLELVRQALGSLPNEAPSNNNSLVGILQRLEEVLELQESDHSRKRLSQLLNSTNESTTIKSVDRDAVKFSHPSESPSFNNSRIRSICMENQLELNESEGVFYEAIVEDLVDKLSQMKQEKEDLQSICNSLGERLQKIGHDCEDKISAMIARCEEEKAVLLANADRLSQEVEELRKQIKTCESNEAKNSDLEEILLNNEQLQLKLSAKSKMLVDMTVEYEKTKSKLEDALQQIDHLKMVEVNHSVNQKILQIDSDGEIELLQTKIVEMEDIIEEYKSKNEALESTLLSEQEKLSLLRDTLSEQAAKNESKEQIIQNQQHVLDELHFRIDEQKKEFKEQLDVCLSEKDAIQQEAELLHARLIEAGEKQKQIVADWQFTKLTLEAAEEKLLLLENHHKSNDDFARSKSHSVPSDAYEEVKSKLVSAERKAEALSADRAKSFALSSRVIAFLESECIRFKSLCDHYRSTNAKLTVEMRAKQLQILKSSETDHKLRLAQMNEQILMEKMTALEKKFACKCEEEQRINGQLHDLQARLELESQSSTRNGNQKLKELEIEFQSLCGEKQKMQELIERLETEKASALEKVQRITMDCDNQLKSKSNLIAEFELECNNLKIKVSELELLLSESSIKLSLMEEQHKATANVYERNLTDIRNDSNGKDLVIAELQREIDVMKKQVFVIENQTIQSGQQLSQNLLQLSREIDENRLYRQTIDEKTREVEELKMLLSTNSNQLSELREHVDELEVAAAQSKVEMSDLKNLARARDEELRQKHSDLEKLRNEANTNRSKLLDLQSSFDKAKSQLLSVQQENAVLRNSESQSRSMLTTLTSENEFLRENMELLSSERSKLSMQVIELTQEIADGTDHLKQLDRAIATEKSKNTLLQEQICSINSELIGIHESLRDLILEFKSVTDKLELADLNVAYVFDEYSKDQTSESILKRVALLISSFRGTIDEADAQLTDRCVLDSTTRHNLESSKLRFIELQMENTKLHDEVHDAKELLANVTQEFDRLRAFSVEQETKHDSERMQSAEKLRTLNESLKKHSFSWRHLLQEVSGLVGTQTLVDNELLSQLTNQDCSFNDSLQSVGLDGMLGEYERFIVDCVESLLHRCSKAINESEELLLFRSQAQVTIMELKETEAQLIESKQILQAELELVKNAASDMELQSEKLQYQIEESSNKCEILTRELEATIKVNSDLIRSLEEAENVCQELNTTIALLQADVKTREEKLDLNAKSYETLLSKLHQVELKLERVSISNSRLKSEKDALENIRKSLEAELDRCRQDLLLIQRRGDDLDIAKCTFEVEKLVGAVEYCVESYGVSHNEKDAHILESSDKKWELFLQSKSKYAVSLLNRLASEFRDDARQKKLREGNLMTKIEELQQEVGSLESLLQSAKENEAQYVSTIQSFQAQMNELSSAVSEQDLLRSKLVEYETEVDNRMKAIEGLKNENIKYSLLSNQLETELSVLRIDLEERNAQIKSLQEQILKDKEQRSILLGELEFRKTQVESMNANVEQVLQSLKLSESMLAEEKERRKKSEVALKALESHSNHDESLVHAEVVREKDSIISDLRNKLRACDTTLEQKQQIEEESKSLCAMLQAKFEECERQLQTVTGEKEVLHEQYLALLGDLDTYKSLQTQLETTIESLQKTMAEERKRSIESSMSSRLDLESKLAHCSTELTGLKSVVRELNQQLLLKEDEILLQQAASQQYQKQLVSNQSNFEQLLKINSDMNDRMEKLQFELQERKNYFAMAEGWVRDIAMKLQVNISDVQTQARDSIRVYIEGIHKSIDHMVEDARSAKDQLAKAQALQLEISTLRLKLNENENQLSLLSRTDFVKIEPTRDDADRKVKHLLNQVKVLEEALRVEVSNKNSAFEEIKHMKGLLEKQIQDNRKSHPIPREDVGELEEMRRECERLQAQVKTMMVHESKLSSFVREMDTKVLQRVNKLVEENTSLFASRLNGTGASSTWTGQMESIRKDIRCKVLEELFSSMVRFVATNLGDSAKTMISSKTFGRFSIICSQLMAEEIEIVCSGYQQEINALEDIANQLCRKWQDTQVYMTELDRQVEDQMRHLYRVGKLDSSSAILQQFSTLRSEANNCQETIQILQTELASLRSRSSASISRLVRDLTTVSSKHNAVSSYAMELERILKEHDIPFDEDCLREMQLSVGKTDDVAMAALVRNLIESDHDLQISERKNRRSNLPTSVAKNPLSHSKSSGVVETFLVNKKPTDPERRFTNSSSAQVVGLPVSKNSKGSSSLRISRGVFGGDSSHDDGTKRK